MFNGKRWYENMILECIERYNLTGKLGYMGCIYYGTPCTYYCVLISSTYDCCYDLCCQLAAYLTAKSTRKGRSSPFPNAWHKLLVWDTTIWAQSNNYSKYLIFSILFFLGRRGWDGERSEKVEKGWYRRFAICDNKAYTNSSSIEIHRDTVTLLKELEELEELRRWEREVEDAFLPQNCHVIYKGKEKEKFHYCWFFYL